MHGETQNTRNNLLVRLYFVCVRMGGSTDFFVVAVVSGTACHPIPGHQPRSHEFSAWGPEKEVSIYLHFSLDLTLLILYNVFFLAFILSIQVVQ